VLLAALVELRTAGLVWSFGMLKTMHGAFALTYEPATVADNLSTPASTRGIHSTVWGLFLALGMRCM
jgi:hypothetical protein